MAVFEMAQHVVSGAAGVIGGSTEIDVAAALASMQDGLLYCGKCHTPKEAYFPKETAQWLGPVSYTHLDVYKRQILFPLCGRWQSPFM